MSPPRPGLITENMPSSTLSPVKRTRSSSSRKQRWLGAWPGVCSTSRPNSVPSIVSPSPMTRSGTTLRVLVDALAVREDLGARGLHQPRGAGRVVGMRVGEHHPAHPLPHRRADDGVDVALVVGTGVDDRDLVDPHEVGVRAGPREGTGIGGDDPAYQWRQRTRHTRSEIRHSAASRVGARQQFRPLHLLIVGGPPGVSGAPLYAAVAMAIDPRRTLPAVERVVARLDGLPQPLLVDCAREAVDAARDLVEQGGSVVTRCRRRRRRRRVWPVAGTSSCAGS